MQIHVLNDCNKNNDTANSQVFKEANVTIRLYITLMNKRFLVFITTKHCYVVITYIIICFTLQKCASQEKVLQENK